MLSFAFIEMNRKINEYIKKSMIFRLHSFVVFTFIKISFVIRFIFLPSIGAACNLWCLYFNDLDIRFSLPSSNNQDIERRSLCSDLIFDRFSLKCSFYTNQTLYKRMIRVDILHFFQNWCDSIHPLSLLLVTNNQIN